MKKTHYLVPFLRKLLEKAFHPYGNSIRMKISREKRQGHKRY
jgi:hypothetical protein